MLHPLVKVELAGLIRRFLQTVNDPKLPSGEIPFILHIDGKDRDSWANIENGATVSVMPSCFKRNFYLGETS